MTFQEEFLSSCGSWCPLIYEHTNVPPFGIHSKERVYRWDTHTNKSDMHVSSFLMQNFASETLQILGGVAAKH